MSTSPNTDSMPPLSDTTRLADIRPDAVLVRAFCLDRNESAAVELVHRYGPMVFGVCRRIHLSEAEDSFQAVWLVFRQCASKIRPAIAIGPWLYGVAVKVALKARSRNHSRKQQQVVSDQPSEVFDPAIDPLLSAVLDEEIARLPEIHRMPLLLCDLCGKNCSEAAAELGWPEGTVATRLTLGRERLAQCLQQRGVIKPAADLSSVITSPVMATPVPDVLILAAKRILSDVPAVPHAVVSLANSVTASPKRTIIRSVYSCMLAAVVLGLGLFCFRLMKDIGKPVLPVVTELTPPDGWVLKSVHKDHGQMVYDAAFSHNGQMFATAGADGKIFLWNAATCEIREKIDVVNNLPPPGPVVAPPIDLTKPTAVSAIGRRSPGSNPPDVKLKFQADGRLAILYYEPNSGPTLIHYDLVARQFGKPKALDSLNWIEDGGRVVGRLQTWVAHLPSGLQVVLDTALPPGIAKESHSIMGGVVSPDLRHVVLYEWNSRSGSSLRICDAKNGQTLVFRELFGTNAAPIHLIVFSPDNQKMAVATIGGRIAVFDTLDWRELIRQEDPMIRSADSLTFTADGQQLLTAGWRVVLDQNWFGMLRSNTIHREIWVWDLQKRKRVQSLPVRFPTEFTAANSASVSGTGLNVCKLALSPDGQMLVASLGSANSIGIESVAEQAAQAVAGEVRVYIRNGTAKQKLSQ